MTECTEVCLQKSVCVEKCLEDRRWLAGNMQASLPCILLQTSISHWFDFILRVRTALLIAANSCNSVVVPNIQSSFFPTKTISEVLWNAMTTPLLRHAGLRSFVPVQVQTVHKWSSLQTHPCLSAQSNIPYTTLGVLGSCYSAEEAPDPLLSLPGWDYAQSLGKCGVGAGRAWGFMCWSLHLAQNNSGDRTASWAVIQAITPG